MAILNNNPLIGSGGNQGYNINNSLRFRSSASAYLNRTPASAGNRKTWTWSAWVKRGVVATPTSPNTAYRVFMAGTTGSAEAGLQFYGSADASSLDAYYYSGGYQWQVTTTQVFRDPSAWYHITLAVDTTQATSSNRVKLYINGNQVTAFATANYPTQNSDTPFNASATPHTLGALTSDSYNYFDGYMADINFIDGSQKAASDFGETDTTTGVWKPKAYTGTYGTNGFYLKFSDIATTSGSNAGLGKDFSGNGNYWTTNNISVTAGTTYDAMTDSPTNTSATVANYCVLNPLQKGSGVTLSNANLTWSTSGSSSKVLSTIGMSSGKYYCEFTMASGNGNYGVATAQTGISGANYLGDDTNSWCYAIDGKKYTNGSGATYGATYTAGDVIGVAFDADAGTLTYYKNGTSQGTAFTGLTSGPYFFAQGADPSAGSVNFGQRPFSYTPPTGYVALNTFNLPTPTILQGNKYMDATLWTGNGSLSRTITNAAGFKPDLIWNKDRTTAYSHRIVDSVRGVRKELYSNSTDQELDQWSTYGSVNSFDSNGFTLTTGGTAGNFISNLNGDAQVAWQWQAGQGSTSSNTQGSITSTVSVNTTAGFSIVTYTGIGSSPKTVGHGLGVAPKMILLKNRSSAVNWYVWHTSLGATQVIEGLNTTGAASSQITFNNTLPTSSVISLGNNDSNNNGTNYVLYVWAEIAGFSRFTSYTGNGSSDGPFIATNFAPKFVMIKQTNTTGDWQIFDTSRSPTNVASNTLYANGSFAEDSNVTNRSVDFLSNGFKIRSSGTFINASGGTFIYMAFAESPFSSNNRAR